MRGFTSESSNGGLISGSFAQTFIISANNGGNGISGLFLYSRTCMTKEDKYKNVWQRKGHVRIIF